MFAANSHPPRRGWLLFAGHASWLGYTLGSAVVLLAIASALSDHNSRTLVAVSLSWAVEVLGVMFLAGLATLSATALYCWRRLLSATAAKRMAWYVGGIEAAGGVATLALTYTLLGISLGIASLADQVLTPETVQAVIRNLTKEFSLAFMSTVIGLPLSAMLRALLSVTKARCGDAVPVA